MCSGCGGHLGHVFFEGANNKEERHCVNSLSIRYVADPEMSSPDDAVDAAQSAAPAAEQSIRRERDAAMHEAMRILMGIE